MRNAQGHPVAHLRPNPIRGKRHVGMLIAERLHLPAFRRGLEGIGASLTLGRPTHGHGHALVIRQITPPCAQDGQPRFGHRLHHGPDLQRWLQRSTQTFTHFHQFEVAGIVPVVVCDITTRAQHALHRAAFDLQFQHRNDQIEHGRSTRRQQHLLTAPQVLIIQLLHQGLNAAHQGAHGFDVVCIVAAAQTAFVAFHTPQAHHLRSGHGLGQGQGLLVGTAARAVSGDAQLQQHIPATRVLATHPPVGQSLQLRQRVHQEPHTGFRVLQQQAVQPIEVGIGHQLVGNDGALRPRQQAHAQLVHIGKGQPPGPCLQLHAKQLGRHGGFAMRGQRHALALHKVLHPGQVVRERRTAQCGHWVRQCVVQQVPAALTQFSQAAGLACQGETFACLVQYEFVFHVPVCPSFLMHDLMRSAAILPLHTEKTLTFLP